MKYRKKSIVVDAFKWNPLKPMLWPGWATLEYLKPVQAGDDSWKLEVQTANGTAIAKPGDWVCMQMVNNQYDIWPVDAAVFGATYEEAA